MTSKPDTRLAAFGRSRPVSEQAVFHQRLALQLSAADGPRILARGTH